MPNSYVEATPRDAVQAYKFWLQGAGADPRGFDDARIKRILDDARSRLARKASISRASGDLPSTATLREELVEAVGPLAADAYARLPALSKGSDAAWAIVLRQSIGAALQGVEHLRERYASVLDRPKEFALFCEEIGDAREESGHPHGIDACVMDWYRHLELGRLIQGFCPKFMLPPPGVPMWQVFLGLVLLLLSVAFLSVTLRISTSRHVGGSVGGVSPLLDSLDTNRDDVLNIAEFMNSTREQHGQVQIAVGKTKALRRFWALDANHNERLSAHELKGVKKLFPTDDVELTRSGGSAQRAANAVQNATSIQATESSIASSSRTSISISETTSTTTEMRLFDTLPAQEMSKACKTSCFFQGYASPCSSRIQWVTEHGFQEKRGMCALAHERVLGDCPVCASCRLDGACKLPTTSSSSLSATTATTTTTTLASASETATSTTTSISTTPARDFVMLTRAEGYPTMGIICIASFMCFLLHAAMSVRSPISLATKRAYQALSRLSTDDSKALVSDESQAQEFVAEVAIRDASRGLRLGT